MNYIRAKFNSRSFNMTVMIATLPIIIVVGFNLYQRTYDPVVRKQYEDMAKRREEIFKEIREKKTRS